MSEFDPTATIRHGDLATLAAVLEDRHARKVDIVVSSKSVHIDDDARMIVPGLDATIDDNGVTPTDGVLTISDPAVGALAERHAVPIKYARRMLADDQPALFAANFNTWLQADDRKMFLRTFTTDDDRQHPGYLRSVLSDGYGVIDDLDTLMAALDAARSVSTDIVVESVNLSERAMSVRFIAPQIQALAPVLLAGYRRPWGPGQAPWETESGRAHGWYAEDERPVVFAGFDLRNSETGAGQWSLAPLIMERACRNGLVFTSDRFARTHIGARMADGIVRYSQDTQAKNVDLIRSMTADTIRTFLDVDYVKAKIAEIELVSGTPVERPDTVIETIARKLRYSDDERQTILAHFIAGGQSTAGGVLQAVTSAAQMITNPDRATEVESSGLDAMAMAAAAA